MTTITIDRATVEQALEALTVAWQQNPRWQITESMHALRTALAQQEEPQDVELSAALGWPGGISNPVLDRKVLLQKVAALAEPTGKESLQVESVVAENATTQQQIEQTLPSEYRRGYWDGFRIGKREGRIEAEDKLAQQAEPVAWLTPGQDLHLNNGEGFRFSDWTPLYTSPPQRKPLTDEEIIDATEHIDTSRNGYFIHIARAIERAHGITDPQVADRLARHGIPMPGDSK